MIHRLRFESRLRIKEASLSVRLSFYNCFLILMFHSFPFSLKFVRNNFRGAEPAGSRGLMDPFYFHRVILDFCPLLEFKSVFFFVLWSRRTEQFWVFSSLNSDYHPELLSLFKSLFSSVSHRISRFCLSVKHDVTKKRREFFSLVLFRFKVLLFSIFCIYSVDFFFILCIKCRDMNFLSNSGHEFKFLLSGSLCSSRNCVDIKRELKGKKEHLTSFILFAKVLSSSVSCCLLYLFGFSALRNIMFCKMIQHGAFITVKSARMSMEFGLEKWICYC